MLRLCAQVGMCASAADVSLLDWGFVFLKGSVWLKLSRRQGRAHLLGTVVCRVAGWRWRIEGDGARGPDCRGEGTPPLGDGARPFCGGCRTGAPLAAHEKRAPLSLRSSVESRAQHF